MKNALLVKIQLQIVSYVTRIIFNKEMHQIVFKIVKNLAQRDIKMNNKRNAIFAQSKVAKIATLLC